jgi:hypothetical protein
VNHVRRCIFILVIDSIDVSVGRLGYMRISGDDWLLHRMPSIGFAAPRNPDREFDLLKFLFTKACRRLQRCDSIPIGLDRNEARAI